ncbi:hypothetical protein DSO57_1015911 [Entomophthora muscae]|uniref:Uncharacterized protein n=1 Tax=Entomophthora muscae TaxID=34485 RepID=A0ACC2RW79_9FUNG|nr:hypothetical protein DSO57_1015911 [Entomophthora muscae]
MKMDTNSYFSEAAICNAIHAIDSGAAGNDACSERLAIQKLSAKTVRIHHLFAVILFLIFELILLMTGFEPSTYTHKLVIFSPKLFTFCFMPDYAHRLQTQFSLFFALQMTPEASL